MDQLARFGISHLARRYVDHLSGGERQRVALIRALAKAPNLLICDEPTASLDEANSLAVIDILAQFAADGAAVLCSTHDPLVMARVTRVIAMSRGRMSRET